MLAWTMLDLGWRVDAVRDRRRGSGLVDVQPFGV
jgi:hypothetical protein